MDIIRNQSLLRDMIINLTYIHYNTPLVFLKIELLIMYNYTQ